MKPGIRGHEEQGLEQLEGKHGAQARRGKTPRRDRTRPMHGQTIVVFDDREQLEIELPDGIGEDMRREAAQPERRPKSPILWLEPAGMKTRTASIVPTQMSGQRLRDLALREREIRHRRHESSEVVAQVLPEHVDVADFDPAVSYVNLLDLLTCSSMVLLHNVGGAIQGTITLRSGLALRLLDRDLLAAYGALVSRRIGLDLLLDVTLDVRIVKLDERDPGERTKHVPLVSAAMDVRDLHADVLEMRRHPFLDRADPLDRADVARDALESELPEGRVVLSRAGNLQRVESRFQTPDSIELLDGIPGQLLSVVPEAADCIVQRRRFGRDVSLHLL